MTEQRRSSVRVVPRRSITVAIDDDGGGPRAFGVVANISETGACVLTNGAFRVGELLRIQLSFAREPTPIAAAGQVVWSGSTKDHGVLRYGLQWADVADSKRVHLQTLITASAG